LRAKKPAADSARLSGEGPANPDPAVFEAAFALEDSEDTSRAGTPKPAGEPDAKTKPSDTDSQERKSTENGTMNPDVEKKSAAPAGSGASATAVGNVAVADLPMEVRVKLRKFDRLESTYTG
jgi:hypothetical protein